MRFDWLRRSSTQRRPEPPESHAETSPEPRPASEDRQTGTTAQAEKDRLDAWSYAWNCLLHEADNGPAELNVGSEQEPRLVPRSEAWQHAYAMHLLVSCDGDHARLTATAERCREDLAAESAKRPGGSEHGRALSRAVDLCNQAAQMVEGAGAVDDDKARRRLVASCRHEGHVIAFSGIPGMAEDSAAELAEGGCPEFRRTSVAAPLIIRPLSRCHHRVRY
jgi:hypothetical protein